MGRDIVTVLRDLSAAGPTSVGAVERAIVKFRASLEPDQIPDAVVFEELAFKFREAHEERADGRYFLPLFTSEGSDGTTVEEPSPRANPVAVVCCDVQTSNEVRRVLPVKFMLTWRIRPGLYKAAFQQFMETGGPPAKGVEHVARYHVPGSVLGWHVLETNDMTALAEHVNRWGDLIDIELHPIVEDAQAAEAAARVFGK